MPDDFELLRQYVERGSSEAFGVLVERHSGMLHGAALRIVRDESRAEEITQAVFVILARKAASLRRGTILAGWLYRTARLWRWTRFERNGAKSNNSATLPC